MATKCPRYETGSELNLGGLPPPRPPGLGGLPPSKSLALQLRGVWGAAAPEPGGSGGREPPRIQLRSRFRTEALVATLSLLSPLPLTPYRSLYFSLTISLFLPSSLPVFSPSPSLISAPLSPLFSSPCLFDPSAFCRPLSCILAILFLPLFSSALLPLLSCPLPSYYLSSSPCLSFLSLVLILFLLFSSLLRSSFHVT